jgi:hypothetical protein
MGHHKDGLKLDSMLECLKATKISDTDTQSSFAPMVKANIDAAFVMHRDSMSSGSIFG